MTTKGATSDSVGASQRKSAVAAPQHAQIAGATMPGKKHRVSSRRSIGWWIEEGGTYGSDRPGGDP
jgi:hypothetical protein